MIIGSRETEGHYKNLMPQAASISIISEKGILYIMQEFFIGGYAVSKAGHDLGKLYVINHMDNEYVYLVDGRIRTLDNPKKKKKIHISSYHKSDLSLEDKIKNKTVTNEEIKRAIKLLQCRNSSKEVE